MIQGFSKQKRVYKGLTVPVIKIELVYVLSLDQKGCDCTPVLGKPYICQPPSAAQEKGPPEDIRCLKTCHIQNITSFNVDLSGKIR